MAAGYSWNSDEYGGTYNESYTWFVAAVVTPGGGYRVPRRVLHCNIHASNIYRKHEITWADDTLDPTIRQWLSAIRPSDTVQIIPKAQFAGWINYVQEAEIAVFGRRNDFNQQVRSNPSPLDAPGEAVHLKLSLYQSLDTRLHEIRLIELHPGGSNEGVSCSLITVPLSDLAREYEALSYVWGDHRQRKDVKIYAYGTRGPITCDLSVTSSLHSAMRSLRPRQGHPRTLWIDALCINQDDLKERSSQVARMRHIYRQASRVIIWLGNGSEDVGKSLAIIQHINGKFQRHRPRPVEKEHLKGLHEPLMTVDLDVEAFIDSWPLFEAAWFRRTWVVQEVFNAKETTVCYGDNTITWSLLLRVSRCIRLSDMKMNSSYKVLLPPIYEEIFSSRVSQADGDISTGLSILEILIRGLDLDSTDPRDKLFAMLQFGKET